MGQTNYQENGRFPVSVSSGIFGWIHEFDQESRLRDLCEVLPRVQEKIGRGIGVELNMVSADWLQQCVSLLFGDTEKFFLRLADAGAVSSIHAPNNVDYAKIESADTATAVKGIHAIHQILPITHDVIHVDLIPPKQRAAVVEAVGKDTVVLEATDGREKGYPARTAGELGELVEQGLKILIDVGHVCHAGLSEHFPKMIEELGDGIGAYHVSSVHGPGGMHYPLASEHGKPVLALLRDNAQKMNGRVRVIESPMLRHEDPVEFIINEYKLLMQASGETSLG